MEVLFKNTFDFDQHIKRLFRKTDLLKKDLFVNKKLWDFLVECNQFI